MTLTAARSGIARSGATRSGYPIAQGIVLPRYALSGVARSGATRSNAHSRRVFASIGGVAYGQARDDGLPGLRSLSISGALDEAPNTAQISLDRAQLANGQEVIVTLGSINNLQRAFAGVALMPSVGFTGTPANFIGSASLIDYTWGLGDIKVTGYYTGTADSIFSTLIATAAPGYTAHVEAMPLVDGGITFTNENLPTCLTRLMARVGGHWQCGFYRDVRAFLDRADGTPPTTLNAVHWSLLSMSVSRDLSQVVTRALVEGGGVNAFAPLFSGDTILPIDGDYRWYVTAGGVVVCGPQRITYTGVRAGGGGGLVGPGAAPSGAPVLALVSGSGLSAGARNYAFTFVTASGESIASPLASITTGLTSAPLTAPTAGTPTIGTGPNPGTHIYALTNVTASGETDAGPSVTVATSVTAAPTAAPTPGVATIGGSVDVGLHDYAVTNVTAIGETTPSPISGVVSTGVTAAPTTAATAGTATIGTGPDAGSHDYAITNVTPVGETLAGPTVTAATGVTPPPTSALTPGTPSRSVGIEDGSHDYLVTFVTSIGEAPGPPSATVTVAPIASVGTPSVAPTHTGGTVGSPIFGTYYRYAYTFVGAGGTETVEGPRGGTINLSGQSSENQSIPTGPSGTIARNIYRTESQSVIADTATAQLKFVGMIADNSTTAFVDTVPDGSLGANVPTSDTTTHAGSVALSSIPVGGTNVTNRKIYRRFNGSGPFKLVTTIANNTATTYADTTSNASLAADSPASNTAYLQRIPLTAIPMGDANVTARNIYRTTAGGSQLKFVATLPNNTATTYTDTVDDASLGANAPTTNTATLNTIPLIGIPLGDANTVSRNLYRRSGGAGLKLLATLANNTATTYSDTTANASLGTAAPSVNLAYLQRIPLSALPVSASALVAARKLYGTAAGGSQFKYIATLNTTDTTYTVTTADGSLGANVPSSNTATANQVALSSIPIGPSGTTQRKVYRTVAAGSQLKLLATIADNTTTTYADSTADGSLGANVPTSDTSGLSQPSGQVLPGSTSLICTNVGSFSASGGWAVIGNGQQVIRYTGVTSTSLTGIPSAGNGSIAAPVSYNSTVTDAPCLTGIPSSGPGSIQYSILKGDPVNILMQVDDLARQAIVAALLTTATFTHTGIIEDYIQDGRLAAPEATARGQARLDQAGDPIITVRARTRDINTVEGREILVNIGAPFNISATPFLIQSVTMSADPNQPVLGPVFELTASSSRFSFEDFLRRIHEAV